MRAWIAIALACGCGERAVDGPVITVPTVTAPAETASAPAPTKPSATLAEGERFAIAIEQDGREAPIADERVEIARKSFVLVVRFAAPGAIMLNASTSPKWFLLAGTGQNATELDDVFGPGHGMADYDPPERNLVLTDDGAHYVYFDDEKTHRCHDATRRDGVIVCRRFVDQLSLHGNGRDIAQLRGIDRLYLVAMMRDDQRELQRARIQIVFH